MAIKIVKIAKQIGPADLPHVDRVIHNMIEQAKDRAVQEGGVLLPDTSVKIIVEQEFTNGH